MLVETSCYLGLDFNKSQGFAGVTQLARKCCVAAAKRANRLWWPPTLTIVWGWGNRGPPFCCCCHPIQFIGWSCCCCCCCIQQSAVELFVRRGMQRTLADVAFQKTRQMLCIIITCISMTLSTISGLASDDSLHQTSSVDLCCCHCCCTSSNGTWGKLNASQTTWPHDAVH